EGSNSYYGIWSQAYHCLVQINNLLAAIQTMKDAGSVEDFDNQIGQVLTLRALIYFDLVRLYGEPYNEDKTAYGVPTITTVLANEAKELRNTVEENYTQRVHDLQEAEDLLSDGKTNGFVTYYGN